MSLCRGGIDDPKSVDASDYCTHAVGAKSRLRETGKPTEVSVGIRPSSEVANRESSAAQNLYCTTSAQSWAPAERPEKEMLVSEQERMWCSNATAMGGLFVSTFAKACFCADDSNFAILRPVLAKMMEKYPNYCEARRRIL